MNELKAMMDQRIIGMESYTEKADYIEAVEETLSITGQLTESLECVISSQWDKINKEFMERSVQTEKYAVAV